MKRLIAIIGIFVLFLGAVNPAGADETAPASMKARFLTDKAVLGETITLSLEFTLPRGAKLTDPVEINGLDSSIILNNQRTDNGLDITLLINSMDAFKVDALRLFYNTPDNNKNWLESQALEIPVDNGLPDDPSKMQPRPIKGLVSGKSFFSQYGPWIGGVLLLLLLAGLGLWFYLKNKRVQALEILSAPPHETALENLNGLETWWAAQGEDKEGYFRLSAIIRSYMGAIRPFPAADLTTGEIRSRIRERDDREILPLLDEADMVKFAKARIAEETRKAHLGLARTYVEKTMPKEEEGRVVEAEIVTNQQQEFTSGMTSKGGAK
ncbi:MAG: hypothetical protein JEZ02_11680 [Desulfatibacillum sp.]|nr:hypothetical protein [Desulfatibacillum sp.]